MLFVLLCVFLSILNVYPHSVVKKVLRVAEMSDNIVPDEKLKKNSDSDIITHDDIIVFLDQSDNIVQKEVFSSAGRYYRCINVPPPILFWFVETKREGSIRRPKRRTVFTD